MWLLRHQPEAAPHPASVASMALPMRKQPRLGARRREKHEAAHRRASRDAQRAEPEQVREPRVAQRHQVALGEKRRIVQQAARLRRPDGRGRHDDQPVLVHAPAERLGQPRELAPGRIVFRRVRALALAEPLLDAGVHHAGAGLDQLAPFGPGLGGNERG